MNILQLRNLILNFLNEDLGLAGDITSSSLPDKEGRAVLIAREGGILCGAPVFEMVFKTLSSEVIFNWMKEDGEELEPGSVVCELRGNVKEILTAERTALNLIQRLSGIATETRKYSKVLEGYPVRLLDTRKTTPGLRVLEKYATRVGGALNHRFGLYDAVMIKDNHIKAFGGVRRAVEEVVKNIPVTAKVEVEIESWDELEELLSVIELVDIVMLDNWSDGEVERGALTLKERKEGIKVEVSGGITYERLFFLRELPIDFVSTSRIVTAAKWMDFSLEVLWT